MLLAYTIGTFFSFDALSWLELNKISTIGSKSFSGLTKLEDLSIEHNSITFIDTNAFDDLVSLNNLYAHHNYLDGLMGLPNVPLRNIGKNLDMQFYSNVFDPLASAIMSVNCTILAS